MFSPRRMSNGTQSAPTIAPTTAFLEALIDGVDSKLIGGILDIYNESSAPFTRNPNCWAFGLTGMSAIGANRGSVRAVTAITSDIVIGVAHLFPPDNSDVTFVTTDGNNTNVVREIVSSMTLGVANAGTYDIKIARLESPLPGTITPLRIPIAGMLQFLPPYVSATSWVIPLVEITQFQKATVMNWVAISDSAMIVSIPTTAPRDDYYVQKVGGDSGHAGMFIDGNELISALSLSTGDGNGLGHFLFLDAITAAIAALGSTTSLSLFDPATL